MDVKTTETQKQDSNSTYAWTAVRYRLWRAHCYADRVEDDKNEAAEAWLELLDEVDEDWWQQHVR